MAIKGGQDRGGQLVWENNDGTIVPVRILVDPDGNIGGDAVIGGFILVDPADNTRKAIFDNVFKIPIFQNIEHGQIHEGVSFERHIDSSNAAVAGLNIAFKTSPDPKLAHMLFGWSSNDEILYEIIEGATWTQGSGSLLAISNLNRSSGANSDVILENQGQPTFTASNSFIKDVTGIAGGTVFENQYTYNASLGAATIAESRAAAHEWVLKADTTYIVRMTQTDGNCKMSITQHWYEQTSE